MSITPVNKLNLQAKCGTLSQYAQKYVKPQIKCISFSLERFFTEIDAELISKNEQKLKEIGIKSVGKDITEGVIVSGKEYDYHVFSPYGEFLNFDIYKQDDNTLHQHFILNHNSNEYIHSGNFSVSGIEDEIIEILDFVDGKIHKAKMKCMPNIVTLPFIKNKASAEKIAEVNRTLRTKTKIPQAKNIGYIGAKENELINTIIDKLCLTQELYKKLPGCRTKYEVKSSYKNYLAQPVANKLGFKDIGPNGESICLFYTTYKKSAHTAISVTDTAGKEVKFVISKDNNSVRKNLPCEFVKSDNSDYRICLTPDYYTQNEIDESNLYSYLLCLDKELDAFIEHTQNRLKIRDERRLIRSNYDTATLDSYKDLLDQIHSDFEKYRSKMRKYLRKTPKSQKFKTENGISTKLASTSVKFDNITSDGYDLRLSYPKVKNDIAMQLLVMKGDEIINSFYVIHNKLLRFNIRDLNDKMTHYNQNLYYYDNKYLQESSLPDYLTLLRDKLCILNKKLDAIGKKQLENRVRYHINSPQKQ